jgi:hypothetical protein
VDRLANIGGSLIVVVVIRACHASLVREAGNAGLARDARQAGCDSDKYTATFFGMCGSGEPLVHTNTMWYGGSDELEGRYMIVKKPKKPTRATKPRARQPKDWRDAIRTHLSKVPPVDAVYVSTASATVHVYSVVKDLHEADYKLLMCQEDRIEKAFPDVSFEFHTRTHQGKKPTGKERHTSELVYLR